MPDWLVRYLKQMDAGLSPAQPVLRDQIWIVGLRVGYAGSATGETIQVDSKTGGVWAQGGPRYSDFDSFHYGVLTDIRRKGR
jgi:hypothetical protein